VKDRHVNHTIAMVAACLALSAFPVWANHTLSPEPHSADTRFGVVAVEDGAEGDMRRAVTLDGRTVAEVSTGDASIHSVTQGDGVDWVLVSLWQGQADCERVFLAVTITASATATADVGSCEGEGRIVGVRVEDGALLVVLPASEDAPAGIRKIGYLVRGDEVRRIDNPGD
jgi:hypothetical protein